MASFAIALRKQAANRRRLSGTYAPQPQPLSPVAKLHTMAVSKRRDRSKRPFKPSKTINKLTKPSSKPAALTLARNRLELALAHSHAPKTSSNYDYAVKHYIKFAESVGFNADSALPASEELILLWVADGLGKTGPGTTKQNLAALRSWHIKNGHHWRRPACIPFLSRAITEFWPKETKRPSVRPPVTSSMVTMLAREWKDGSPREKCALAVALTAWCGQARLGEILPPSKNDVDAPRLPKRADWLVSKEEDCKSQLKIPWSKTTSWGGETIFLINQHPPLDATDAMQAHFDASPISTKNLICEFKSGRMTRILAKDEFMAMCNDIWSRERLPRITGHSFRIGGTTALLCSGKNPEFVKKFGRWHSDAFLTYWRSLGTLFAKNLSNATWAD